MRKPQQFKNGNNATGVRPDPIDIDDGLIDKSERQTSANDPEELQKVFMSGLRKPDREPMSLHRFRKEYKDEIRPTNQEASDIDNLSDSNYSLVEQVYKDMDDFDTKVDHHHEQKYNNYPRVADSRAHGQKSHNSIMGGQKMPKTKIRY